MNTLAHPLQSDRCIRNRAASTLAYNHQHPSAMFFSNLWAPVLLTVVQILNHGCWITSLSLFLNSTNYKRVLWEQKKIYAQYLASWNELFYKAQMAIIKVYFYIPFHDVEAESSMVVVVVEIQSIPSMVILERSHSEIVSPAGLHIKRLQIISNSSLCNWKQVNSKCNYFEVFILISMFYQIPEVLFCLSFFRYTLLSNQSITHLLTCLIIVSFYPA